MKLIKCENGHYFNSDKFVSCPHCANQNAEVCVDDILGKSQNKIDTAIPQYQTQQNSHKLVQRKTVGWLVCVKGTMLGDSFTLREGDNCIGRAGNMDIALVYEASVSRNKHAIITYDFEKNACFLHSPDHASQTLCNQKAVKKRRKLKNRDLITLGDSSFLFISFCNAAFTWAKYNTD